MWAGPGAGRERQRRGAGKGALAVVDEVKGVVFRGVEGTAQGCSSRTPGVRTHARSPCVLYLHVNTGAGKVNPCVTIFQV